ncbi:MAG: hypothetical protein M1818_000143 [Claussenomyces sp. TS43310]|nr:MAG: hypothetical protein M1818_000143 [Claussenomyces sp. TS43310]
MPGTRSILLSTALVLICLWALFYTSDLSATSVSLTGGSLRPSDPGRLKASHETPDGADSISADQEIEAMKQDPATLPHSPPTSKIEDRPLILYAYSESDFARENLRFFLDHGLHAAADFIFILNGDTDVDSLIFPPVRSDIAGAENLPVRSRSNVMIRRRDNSCYDLGAHAEVLESIVGGKGWFDHEGPISAASRRDATNIPEGRGFDPDNEHLKLRNRYRAYVLMNASIRGPFAPTWSTACWSDAYLNRVTEKVKLVGMSYNCHGGRGHLQSMIWATDAVGLNELLRPTVIGQCFSNMHDAQEAEIETTPLLREAGFEVDAFLSVYHSQDKAAKLRKLKDLNVTDGATTESGGGSSGREDTASPVTLSEPGEFWKGCQRLDFLQPNEENTGYYGTFVHPYENFFMKSHRHLEDTVLDTLTNWHDGMGYESYDFCQ